jgi:coatomer subunit beta'
MAYDMTPDLDHKFELSLVLNKVEDAFKIAQESDSAEKWKQVGDIALSRGQFTMAEQCYLKSNDFNSLLLFYSSYGD